MSIKIKTLEFLFEDTYSRIENGLPYSLNLKSYSPELIKQVLDYFEKKEEFEKCIIINKFLQNRFNHEENYFNKS